MAYAIPDGDGWKPLGWPAPKVIDRRLIRPGTAGVTQALLDAVGAVEIADAGLQPPDGQVVESRALTDVDGVPTVVYTYRAKTQAELDTEAQAAADEAEREQARQAVDNLRAYIDLSSPTGAQTVAVVKLLCRICIRLIRDSF